MTKYAAAYLINARRRWLTAETSRASSPALELPVDAPVHGHRVHRGVTRRGGGQEGGLLAMPAYHQQPVGIALR
ncbi:MAG: hypothetical protein ACLT98_10645 [Eggerthellaceae bacterium]